MQSGARLFAAYALLCSVTSAEDLPVDTVFIRLLEDVDVPARAPGVLVNIAVTEGQHVKRGDLLGQIEDAEQRLEAEMKNLDREIARKQAENQVHLDFAVKESAIAEEQLTRAQNSREALKKSVSLKEIEDLKLALERATTDVKRSRYELEIAALTHEVKKAEVEYAERQLERRRIQSPIDGLVTTVDREPGEWVQPGDRVFRIVRLDLLRAEGFVDAQAALDGVLGAAVTVTVQTAADKSEMFRGKIVFVDPEVEPATSQVRVRAVIANEGLRLRPGMRANMTIHKHTDNVENAQQTEKPPTPTP
jgi:multidrug efflux pump subunit AcrA (membrane-fusion protein)